MNKNDFSLLDFDKDVTIAGKWWLPESKTELYGELIYKRNEELFLSVTGGFNGQLDIRDSSIKKHALIHGIDNNGNSFALLNASGYTYGKIEFLKSRFDIAFVFKTDKYILFDPSLHKVIAANFSTNFFMPFMLGKYKMLDGPSLHKNTLSFSLEDTPDLEIIDTEQLNAKFIFSYGYYSTGLSSLYEFNLSQDIYLRTDFKKETDLIEAVQEANFMKDFFSFFCYRQISFRKFHLITEDPINPGHDLYFSVLFIEKASRIGQDVRPYDVMLPYKDFPEEIEQVFSNWYKEKEFILNGLSLYLDVSYLKIKQPVHAFLSLVYTIETFHRIFYQPTKKEITLVKRLEYLIKNNKEILSDFIPDSYKFSTLIVKQRNYLAHNHGTTHAVMDNSNYDYYIICLKIIFEISFLKKLGMNTDALKILMTRNPTYSYFKQNKK
jgi:ApeA-like protein/HEPN superfamily Apea-like protein